MKSKNKKIEDAFNYLKPVCIISIIFTVVFIIMAVYYKYWGIFIIYLSFGIGFIPLILLGIVTYNILRYCYKPLKLSQFYSAIIFSIIFYVLIFNFYKLATRTPTGVKIFFPLRNKKIKDHFIKKYGMEFKVEKITYYLDMGSAGSSGHWKKSISGSIVNDFEIPVNVWVSEEGILDNYEKKVFEREVKAYYEKLFRDIIPWEFKPYLYISHVYNTKEGKNYENVFEEKNDKIISSMSISIMSSNDIFKKYGKNEYQNIYLKVMKMLYKKNYYSKDIIISFRLLDIKPDELKKEEAKILFLKYPHAPYLLVVSIKDLKDDFLEVQNFNELERYLKNKSLKGVERWIEN